MQLLGKRWKVTPCRESMCHTEFSPTVRLHRQRSPSGASNLHSDPKKKNLPMREHCWQVVTVVRIRGNQEDQHMAAYGQLELPEGKH